METKTYLNDAEATLKFDNGSNTDYSCYCFLLLSSDLLSPERDLASEEALMELEGLKAAPPAVEPDLAA